MQIKHKDVIILGGGICGLSASHFLHKKKIDFMLLEKEIHVGGIWHSKFENVVPYEFALNDLKLNNDAIKAVFTDLNLNEKLIFPSEQAIDKIIFYKGKNYKLPQNTNQMMFSDLLSWYSKFKLMSEVNTELFENITVEAFFEKAISKEFVSQIIQPCLNIKQLGNANETLLYYAFPNFFTLYREEQNFKKAFNALLDDLGHENYMIGGIQSLVQALFTRIINEIQTDTEITQVYFENGKYIIKTNENIYTSYYIINTLPASVTMSVLNIDYKLNILLEKLNFYNKSIVHIWVKKSKMKFPSIFGIYNSAESDFYFDSILFYNNLFFNKKNNIKCIINISKNESEILNEASLKYNIHKHLYKLYGVEKIKNIDLEIWNEAAPVLNENFHELQLYLKNELLQHSKTFYSLANYTNANSISEAMKQAESVANAIFRR